MASIGFFFLFFWCACVFAADTVKVTEQAISLSGVPESWKTLRIALISDLHLLEKNCTQSPFPELSSELNRLKPDLILIAGDIFHGVPVETPDAMHRAFSTVFDPVERPPLGIYAVCGNHDELPGYETVRGVLARSGVSDPEEKFLEIPFSGGTLHLTSITNPVNRETFPLDGEKLKRFAPCILLTHYPDNFDGIPDDLPVLAVAGHTHGGLVNIPGFGRGAAYRFIRKRNLKFVYGLYRTGKKVLFVTAGIGGEGGSRHRINNPPEIVMLRFE